MTAVVDGRDNLGIVGHLNRQRRTTVERFLCREHTCATGMERSELQSVLVSLSAGVDEKQLIVVITARLAQPFCQLLLQSVDDGVAVEAELRQLGGKHRGIMRMTMTYRYDGRAAIKILGAVVVPYVATGTLGDVNIE